MLRLKASEITLTPAHVEETRRRMERRQAANAPATLPARIHGPSLPPDLGARLRRGPVRSRHDAVASLGNIPILRPQQAVHTSTEDPGDDAPPHIRESLIEGSEILSSEPSSPPFPDDQASLGPSSTMARLVVPLPGSDMELAFRPAPRHRDSSRFASQDETGEDNTPSPSKLHLSPPRLGQARTNSSETGNDDASPSFNRPSTDGLVDSAPEVETPVIIRTRSLRQHSSHVPSPLQHVQRISSPRRGHNLEEGITGNNREGTPTNESSATEESSPPRFIRGYWDSHQRYRFIECAPQTDPRPRTQPSRRGRAMSSSSEPSYQPRFRRPDTSGSAAEDIFWNTPAPEPPPRNDNVGVQNSTGSSNDRYWSPLGSDGMGYRDPLRTTSGRHSSGASTTSQAYSFYELPDSRHSSSSYPQREPLEQSQYDGAAPSRQVSRGAYYSIRLPQSRTASGAFLRPPPPSRASSTSSPDLSTFGQHGFSPLPARPYTRVPSAQHPLVPSTGLISVADFVGGDQDATRAVQRDLSSPLELIQERAAAYIQRISTRMHDASSQTRTAESRPQHRDRGSDEVADRRRRTSDSGSLRHESGNSAHSRMSAQPRARMNYTLDPALVPPLPEHARVAHGPRRTVPAARAGQRSSENVPVGQSIQEGRPHTTHVPIQRASLVPQPTRPGSGVALRGGDLSTSPIMARFSMPQVPRPRDMSNRPHMHSPHPLLLSSSDDDPSGSDTLTPIQNPRLAPPNPPHGPRIPPRQASRQHFLEAPQRQPMRRAVTPIPAPLPFSRQSERGLPSTSTTFDSASGVTSRRAQVGRVAASRRRVFNEQENSEETEREAMRGESAGVEWRLGVKDVMDETPPRMGRYERFLFN